MICGFTDFEVVTSLRNGQGKFILSPTPFLIPRRGCEPTGVNKDMFPLAASLHVAGSKMQPEPRQEVTRLVTSEQRVAAGWDHEGPAISESRRIR